MKRIIAVLSLSFALLAACGRGDSRIVGGYTDERRLTDEERQLFDAAVASTGDVEYKPMSVATQVVAGTNYRFICKARETKKRGKRFDAVIVIYKPLPGQGEPRITSIERSAR